VRVGAVVGAYGAPALRSDSYYDYDPELAINVLARLTLPTGDYEDDRIVNLGANRWDVQLGVPIVYYAGDSFVDPELTTIELTPSIFVFGQNDDPFVGSELDQDPLFQLEGHLTHNLSRVLWVSFDATYVDGGERDLDGVSLEDGQRAIALGGTLGVEFNRFLAIKASYGDVIDHNDDGPDGHALRFDLTYTF
jgi:hypothetical protein